MAQYGCGRERREALRKQCLSRVKDFRDKASERVFVWEIVQSPRYDLARRVAFMA